MASPQNTARQCAPSLTGIPQELQDNIYGHLEDEDVVAVRSTCRRLRDSTEDAFVERFCIDQSVCIYDAASWARLGRLLSNRLSGNLALVKISTDRKPMTCNLDATFVRREGQSPSSARREASRAASMSYSMRGVSTEQPSNATLREVIKKLRFLCLSGHLSIVIDFSDPILWPSPNRITQSRVLLAMAKYRLAPLHIRLRFSSNANSFWTVREIKLLSACTREPGTTEGLSISSDGGREKQDQTRALERFIESSPNLRRLRIAGFTHVRAVNAWLSAAFCDCNLTTLSLVGVNVSGGLLNAAFRSDTGRLKRIELLTVTLDQDFIGADQVEGWPEALLELYRLQALQYLALSNLTNTDELCVILSSSRAGLAQSTETKSAICRQWAGAEIREGLGKVLMKPLEFALWLAT